MLTFDTNYRKHRFIESFYINQKHNSMNDKKSVFMPAIYNNLNLVYFYLYCDFLAFPYCIFYFRIFYDKVGVRVVVAFNISPLLDFVYLNRFPCNASHFNCDCFGSYQSLHLDFMDVINALVLNLSLDWLALPRYLHFLPFLQSHFVTSITSYLLQL